MIDIDKIERLAKAASTSFLNTPGFRDAASPSAILSLIAQLRARDETIRQLEGEVRELGEDAERLDYLDCMNAQLNKFYSTNYQWKVILSPNIVRLTAGRQWAGYVGDIDLNDAQCGEGSFASCRKAIDEARGAK